MTGPRPEIGLPRLFAGLRVVASSTLLSRVLGMFRDVASARLFGLGPVWDAFSFAFLIPNLARRLFGEGALSAAFLPAFARELERDPRGGSQSAWQLASLVLAILAAVLTGLVLAGELITWALAWLLEGKTETQLMLGLTAVMLPYATLICLAAQLTAVLHALGHFAWPALVPVVLNVCWIATIWLVDPWFEPDRIAQAYALAVCIVLAGVLQLVLQWPTLRKLGFRFDSRWHSVRPAVGEIVRGMLPVTLGLSITQINTVLDRLIAWTLTQPADAAALLPLPGNPAYPLLPGAISALYFGERMYQFPLGVFGVALGTVLFPLLSRHAARGDLDRVRDDLSLGLRLVLAIGIPASAGLALVAEPLTRVLFQHGQFSSDDAQRTAGILVAYGAGVWAYCGIPVLYRGFYALGERKLPVQIGMAAVVLDLTMNLTLIWPLAERGLAWSTAVSAGIQVAALGWIVQKRVGRLDWRRLATTGGKALLATCAMSAVCLAALRPGPSGAGLWREAAALVVPTLLGGATYFGVARALGIKELSLLFVREPNTPPPG
ncbi:MAG TPA: murein biosynthesis integral membrane protein MurJ [Planctomycetaceae bacterium]|nr:murein biosynthesis integral membrane protein MurJ [Planctomycetaceae bacterium]